MTFQTERNGLRLRMVVRPYDRALGFEIFAAGCDVPIIAREAENIARVQVLREPSSGSLALRFDCPLGVLRSSLCDVEVMDRVAVYTSPHIRVTFERCTG